MFCKLKRRWIAWRKWCQQYFGYKMYKFSVLIGIKKDENFDLYLNLEPSFYEKYYAKNH